MNASCSSFEQLSYQLQHFTHLSKLTVEEAYTSQYNTHPALLITKGGHDK